MRHSSTISDELLSAYIDRQINEAELRRVEKALVAEPALQQRLETLQATVALLRSAPSLVAPRAFVLSENQVLAAGGRVRGVNQPGFWERWLPRLTPVATAIIAILFIFSIAHPFQSVETNEMAAMPASTVLMNKSAKEAPEMQSLAVEQPAAAPRVAESRDAVAKGANDEEPAVSMAAASADETEKVNAAPQSLSAEQPSSRPEPQPAPAGPRVSWTTWLLGLLLILFIFLTWRVTIARWRRE